MKHSLQNSASCRVFRLLIPKIVIVAVLFGLSARGFGSEILAKFEFTKGSLAPSEVAKDIEVSNLNIGRLTPSEIQVNDRLEIPTGVLGPYTPSSLPGGTHQTFLQFTVAVPAGKTISLDKLSISFNYTPSGNRVSYASMRVFSSVRGFDDYHKSVIGYLGSVPRPQGGSMVVLNELNLSKPASNEGVGESVSEGDFQNLTNTKVTFVFPLISQDPKGTIVIDDITLFGK